MKFKNVFLVAATIAIGVTSQIGCTPGRGGFRQKSKSCTGSPCHCQTSHQLAATPTWEEKRHESTVPAVPAESPVPEIVVEDASEFLYPPAYEGAIEDSGELAAPSTPVEKAIDPNAPPVPVEPLDVRHVPESFLPQVASEYGSEPTVEFGDIEYIGTIEEAEPMIQGEFID